MAFESKRAATLAAEAAVIRFEMMVEAAGQTDGPELADLRIKKNTIDFDLEVNGDFKIRYQTTPELANHVGVLHGGSVSGLFDTATSAHCGMLGKNGMWEFAHYASRNLNVTFLRPVPIGTNVTIFSRAISMGKTMAYFEASMETDDRKKVFAVAQHQFIGFPVAPENKERMAKMREEAFRLAEKKVNAASKL